MRFPFRSELNQFLKLLLLNRLVAQEPTANANTSSAEERCIYISSRIPATDEIQCLLSNMPANEASVGGYANVLAEYWRFMRQFRGFTDDSALQVLATPPFKIFHDEFYSICQWHFLDELVSVRDEFADTIGLERVRTLGRPFGRFLDSPRLTYAGRLVVGPDAWKFSNRRHRCLSRINAGRLAFSTEFCSCVKRSLGILALSNAGYDVRVQAVNALISICQVTPPRCALESKQLVTWIEKHAGV